MPYAYLAPAVALLGLVFAYPVARVIDFSMRLIRGDSGPFVGRLNYRAGTRRPDLPRGAETQRDPAPDGAGARRDRTPRLRAPLRPDARLARVPKRLLFPLHPRGSGRRHRRQLHLHAERRAQRHPSTGRPRAARSRLDRKLALRPPHTHDRDRLARGRLRDHRLPGAPADHERGGDRSGADRRGRVVGAPSLHHHPGAPGHDGVLCGRRRHHDARLGLRLRVHADEGRARHRNDRDRALHLQPGAP